MRKAVALLLSVLLLTACTTAPAQQGAAGDQAPAQAQEGNPAPPDSSALTTIRVLGNSYEFDALIAAYHEKYPTDRVVMVEVFPQTGEAVNMDEVVTGKIERGEIDVVAHLSTDLIREGKVLPLDPFIQKEGFDLAPFGPALERLRYEGKLYELPHTVYPTLLAYNKAIFAKAGVTPPVKGWTWDDLRAIAQKLTQGEGDQKIWGLALESSDSLAGLYMNQGSFEDEQLVKDAFQLFGTMIQVDQSMPKAQRRAPGSNAPIIADRSFLNQRAAMTFIGAADLVRLFENRASFSIDVAPTPVRPGRAMVSLAYPQTFGIAANSPNQEAAWRFISFVSGPEGAAAYAKAGGVPLYNTPAVRSAWFEQEPPPPPGTGFLFETTWVFPRRSSSGGTSPTFDPERAVQFFENLTDNLNAVMAAEKNWEDGFAEYQQALKEWQEADKGD